MSDPSANKVTVDYRDGEPAGVRVETCRWKNDYRYNQTYKFRMEGSRAVLAVIEGDGNSYHVRANEGTRAAAADAVRELPFVQGVVMFGDAAEE